MCPGNPTTALRRRFKFGSRNKTNIDNSLTTFPLVVETDDDANKSYSGIFRSSTTTARSTVLAIASIVLLVLSLLGLISTANNYYYYYHGATTSNRRTLTDLTNTMLHLTKQIQTTEGRDDETINDNSNNNNNDQKIKALKQQLIETQTALTNEEQKLNSKMTDTEKIRDSLLDQINNDKNNLRESDRKIERVAAVVLQNRKETIRGEEENANLKIKLAFAIEELENIREPPSSSVVVGRKNNNLRGGGGASASRDDGSGSGSGSNVSEFYRPGDNVEIFEHVEGTGEVALRPAIISNANTDGTYDMVQLETGHLNKNLETQQFRTYQILLKGQSALYQDSRIGTAPGGSGGDDVVDVVEPLPHYVPVTIVQFVRDSAREGHELHGRYQFRIDGDGDGSTTIGEIGEIKEGNAAMIHGLIF
mmetsp:Transcript_977/g.1681  ORF Transcript_977/g.1681 Transcript_977/m.1681 type:complete len:421 (+) Transcript_977:180-1442(+)